MPAARPFRVWLLALLALGCLPRPSVVVLVPEPRAVVDEDVFDFGEVSIGDPVRHRFVLENQGRRPLTVVAARSGCDCTTTIVPGGTIAAGGSGWVDVEFDTSRSSGDRRRTITLSTNDPSRPELVLSLRGHVRPDVTVAPDHVFHGRVPVGAARTRVVEIDAAPGVRILTVKTESPRLEMRVEKKSSGVRLHVTLRPQNTRGSIDDRVMVTTSSSRQPTILVPILAVVQ